MAKRMIWQEASSDFIPATCSLGALREVNLSYSKPLFTIWR